MCCCHAILSHSSPFLQSSVTVVFNCSVVCSPGRKTISCRSSWLSVCVRFHQSGAMSPGAAGYLGFHPGYQTPVSFPGPFYIPCHRDLHWKHHCTMFDIHPCPCRPVRLRLCLRFLTDLSCMLSTLMQVDYYCRADSALCLGPLEQSRHDSFCFSLELLSAKSVAITSPTFPHFGSAQADPPQQT